MRLAVNHAIGILLFCSAPLWSRSDAPCVSAPQADTAPKAAEAPVDVPANHWAYSAVRAVIRNGVLAPSSDHKFHGDDTVSKTDAAIAIAKVAHELVDGVWQKSPSVIVGAKAINVLKGTSWQAQPVTRYTCAKVLAQSADYVANGLPRPPQGSADLGKSDVLPKKITITITHTNPAFDAVTYLAAHHMMSQKSPILSPDSHPIRGAELAISVHEMLAGVTDALTELGHDASGATRDDAFHQKKQ